MNRWPRRLLILRSAKPPEPNSSSQVVFDNTRIGAPTMLVEIPPSGPWKGYYLYGHRELRHRMALNLTFTPTGGISGEGIDDIGRFVIDGSFNRTTSAASWLKTYIGMHTVNYSGIYCAKTICGDWMLGRAVGGFWIWPSALGDHEIAHGADEVELQLGLVADREPAGSR